MVGLLKIILSSSSPKIYSNKSEKNFSTILELAPLAVGVINGEDQITSANIAMTDRLGLSDIELKKFIK
jgi:epidermal growth factor receptor substrate 15